MTPNQPTMFQVIRQTYEAHGITVADIAKRRIRRHIFYNKHLLDEFLTSNVGRVTLPPLAISSYRDIQISELKTIAKELGSEIGVILTISPQKYSGLPFLKISLIRTRPERRN